jgi:hypothetical protein
MMAITGRFDAATQLEYDQCDFCGIEMVDDGSLTLICEYCDEYAVECTDCGKQYDSSKSNHSLVCDECVVDCINCGAHFHTSRSYAETVCSERCARVQYAGCVVCNSVLLTANKRTCSSYCEQELRFDRKWRDTFERFKKTALLWQRSKIPEPPKVLCEADVVQHVSDVSPFRRNVASVPSRWTDVALRLGLYFLLLTTKFIVVSTPHFILRASQRKKTKDSIFGHVTLVLFITLNIGFGFSGINTVFLLVMFLMLPTVAIVLLAEYFAGEVSRSQITAQAKKIPKTLAMVCLLFCVPLLLIALDKMAIPPISHLSWLLLHPQYWLSVSFFALVLWFTLSIFSSWMYPRFEKRLNSIGIQIDKMIVSI